MQGEQDARSERDRDVHPCVLALEKGDPCPLPEAPLLQDVVDDQRRGGGDRRPECTVPWDEREVQTEIDDSGDDADDDDERTLPKTFSVSPLKPSAALK